MRKLGGYLLALLALILAQVVGTVIVDGLALPVPGPVAGLLVLLAVLVSWGRIPEALGDVAAFLLRHLNLFFVPAGVGLMAYLSLLARDGWAIGAAILLSTLAGLVVAGWVFTIAARAGAEKDGGEGGA